MQKELKNIAITDEVYIMGLVFSYDLEKDSLARMQLIGKITRKVLMLTTVQIFCMAQKKVFQPILPTLDQILIVRSSSN
jgi:hypothetical protein